MAIALCARLELSAGADANPYLALAALLAGVHHGLTHKLDPGPPVRLSFKCTPEIFTELCEKTREDAFELMVDHAVTRGGNAIIGMRYDATEIMNGVTEVLAYGTAVVIEPIQPQQ